MRRTRHRRRFHTDRIVSNRRRRYIREYAWGRASDIAERGHRFSYGALSSRDPWDCGGHCLLCHGEKFLEPRRARENRAWRRDWNV